MVDTFISIDTETTGLSFTDDRVIEFGATVFLRGKAVHRAGFYIKTDVPNGGYSVNGITPSEIENGYEPAWAFLMIASLIHKAPRTVLAYNAPFDLTMLAHEFRRHDIRYDYSRLRIIDPLVVYRRYHPFQPARLTNAADRYRIPYDNAHTAMADSEAAGHVWCAMRHHHSLYRASYQSLEERQVRWYNEWATSFKDWATKKGKTVDLMTWPYDKEIECSLGSEQLSLLSQSSLPSSSFSTSPLQSW